MKLHTLLWTAVAMLLFAASLTLGAIEVASAQSSAVNVAGDGVASQSSTDHGGDASRAIDGDTDGRYGADSVTHTDADDDAPWFQVALAESTEVERIVLWNRTDNCCEQRLRDFTVFVSPTRFAEGATRSELEASSLWSHSHDGAVGERLMIDVDVVGSYVRVYKDTAVSSLAEIEVFGTPATTAGRVEEAPSPQAAPASQTRPSETYGAIGDVNCDGELDISDAVVLAQFSSCLLYTSPSPRDATLSRMPSSA